MCPLGAFPLRWRFTSSRHAQLGADGLARLKPLAPAVAAELADDAAHRCRAARGSPFTFRSDDAPAIVRRQLLDLPIDPSALVILSWDRGTAVITDWDMFTAHWDDFCYPASDDVSIWPVGGEWTLCYRRYEVFQLHDAPACTGPASSGTSRSRTTGNNQETHRG